MESLAGKGAERHEGMHHQAGRRRHPVGLIRRKARFREATFFNWKKTYAGLMPSEMKRLRLLELVSLRLERNVAGLALGKERLSE